MSNLLSTIVRRSREERLAQGAGGLTFTTAISVVPLLVVSFALFTRVPALRGAGNAIREHLLAALLPPAIASAVVKQLARFVGNAGGLTTVGGLALLVSALGLVLAVESTLNRIWQVKKPRPLLRRLALCVAMLLGGPVIVGASLWATASAAAASSGWIGSQPAWLQRAVSLAPIAFSAIAFACLYRFVPHADVRRRHALAGGLLAGGAFELGKRGFAMYLASVPTYRTLYGGFAPLLAFLLWVYYSWFVTLGAALVSASLAGGGRQRARARRA
jgi:membrane protein